MTQATSANATLRSASSRRRNARLRVMTIVVPIVVIVFLLLAIANAIRLRNLSLAQLTSTHQAIISGLSQDMNAELEEVADDARRLANNRTAREFARDTLSNVTGSALDQSQQRLLNDFLSLIQQNTQAYAAVRYVTFTGSVWTEVTSYGTDNPTPDNRVRLGELENDPQLATALSSSLGTVAVSPVEFYRNPGGSMAERLLPILRITSPVAVEGNITNIAGVIQIDALVEPLLAQLRRSLSTIEVIEGRRILLVDNEGRVWLDSANPGASLVRDIATGSPTLLVSVVSPAAQLISETASSERFTTGNSVVNVAVNRDNRVISTADIALPDTIGANLRVVLVDDFNAIQNAGLTDGFTATLIMAGMAALIIGAIWVTLGRVLTPIQGFSAVAESLVRQSLGSDSTPVGSSTTQLRAAIPSALAGLPPDDEIRRLFEAFQMMAQRVDTLQHDIETQVGRYSRNLDIAARIGRETATLYDTDQLLNRAIDLICEEFGFYHAQVFLIDDVGQNAVLVYSYGETGKKLLAQKHKLAIGSDSVIGRVTATGKPVVVNDTEATSTESPHRFNPLLPETRSEMALPLQVADRIIGTLDIQSVQPGMFETNDLSTFQLLADQIAVALQNARLLVETNERFEQIDTLNRQLTRMAWEDTGAREMLPTVYEYDLMKVESSAEAGRALIDDEEGEALTTDTQLRMPITIRGEVIGVIDAQTDAGESFSESDQAIMRAVADRVAIAIENARLFEETQSSLSETSTLYQLSRYLSEANTLEDILQAIIVSMMPDAAGGQIGVFADYVTRPEQIAFTADWARSEKRAGEIQLTGLELNVSDHAILRDMQPDKVQIIADTSRDQRLDEVMRAVVHDRGAQSLVLIPFSVRGVWRGVIMIEFAEKRTFSEREERVYAALIDQAGVAIDNRMLLRQNEMALAQIERLYSASRIINMAQTLPELVSAAVTTLDDDQTTFALGVLEGDTDASGWARQMRMVAYTRGKEVFDDDSLYDLSIPKDSPLRSREAEVVPLRGEKTDHALVRIAQARGANFMAVFPLFSGSQPIALFFITSVEPRDLSEEDYEVYRALTGQMSTVLQNRQLFRAAESERERLRLVLETLPAGVLVLDPATLRPTQANLQAEQLLGDMLDYDQPFDIARYRMYRTGTDQLYPEAEMPIFVSASSRVSASADDIAILMPNGDYETNLLINAAPITDSAGAVTAIVAAFQDITPLRSLENTLQQNLRETIALYETTRALAEAEEADDVLQQVLEQVAEDDPADAQVLLLDDEYGGARLVRSLNEAGGEINVPDELLTFGDAQFVDNLEHTSVIDEVTKGKLRAIGIQAYVSIPLRARARRDAPMGWLVILFDQPRPDMAEREQFLSTLADSAAVALDNRQLFRSTQVALQETASLYGATTTIAQARNLDQLTTAVSNALESLQPDMYAAYLRDASGELRELFNTSLDAAPLPMRDWVTDYKLLGDVRTNFVDDLRQLDQPTAFDTALQQQGTIRSFGLVQLRAQNKAAGLLFVAYHAPHRFSSGDARYLSAIAESTSVVADNILLLAQIQNSLQETSALYQASQRLSNAEDNHDILDAVTQHLTGRPLDLAFITLLSTQNWAVEGAIARVAASWQQTGIMDLTGIALRADDFAAWRQLSTDAVLMIDDVAADPRLEDAERTTFADMGLRSAAVLPLRVANRVIGSLCFGSAQPYHHTERDQRVYAAFAEQASLRMEATRLLAQTERRARQLATSAEVTQIASSILDVNELMPRIVDMIKDAFRYDHVQIFLMDSDDNYAELRASTGEPGQKLLSIKHKLQKGSLSVIGTVTKTGKPTIAADTADADVIHRPNPYLPHTRSEMAVPLVLKGKVVGALDVQSNTPSAFDADDVAVLTTLAGQIATAIDNAQLFEQSQQRANEMSFLFTVTTAAASAETLNDALQNVAQELRDSLDALSVSLYLPAEYLDKDENLVTLLRPVALAGASQPLSELSEIVLGGTDNLIAIAAHDLQPVRLNNVELEARYLPVTEGARSAIIVPLSAGGTLVGLIAAESDRVAAYDQSTLTLLLTLSGTLSAIVQNQSLLEQVQRTNEQLRELDRLKSDFLANMSHELRTPLNSIIGFSRVILKGIDGPLTEMQEQDLSTIYNSGVHLLGLINDILDQAKIAAGKMDLQFDYFEMRQVIDGVRSIGIGLVKEKPIDIIVDIAPGLPKAYGDEFRTRQVLLNLISNAAKFTREGSITIRSYPQRNEEGKMMVRVDVTDTGIGIAEPDIPLLFEAFRQVDSSLTRTAGGTGLGLPIAKSLIEMQMGTMLVESRVNVGSTFSILIPVEPAEGRKPQTDELSDSSPLATGTMNAVSAESANGKDQEDTHIIPPAGQTQPNPPDARQRVTTEIKMARPPMHVKRQILLIEDNPDMVDQFRRSLQREGFDIFAASIPLEAEAMASGLHPTIIIMDVNFGGGAGWEILERLRQRDDTVDIPVIIVTLNQENVRGNALGVFRWIQRPFTPETLVKAVQDAEEASRVDRILIIDDEPESVRLLRELLGLGGGYKVFSAQNGMEGIAMVARRRPNLVIVDLRMPEMDGFAVIKELRNNPETATIPILVVTGDTALTPTELEQLRSFRVLYKAEISAEQYRPFIDGVRTHLQHPNQVMGE